MPGSAHLRSLAPAARRRSEHPGRGEAPPRLCFTSTAREREEDGLLSNAQPSAIRSEGSRNRSDSPGVPNKTLAYSRTPAPAAVQCAWCERRFDRADERLTGRVRCARCGVATTTPWPSDEQLSAAYAEWYRPKAGRFSGL